MSLLKLKSIFSPTNTKFQDNQTDLSTFPRQFDNDFQQTNLQDFDSKFDDGLNIPLQSSLLDETSVFEEETKNKTTTYISNQISFGNSNLNYNENQIIPQTYGSNIGIEEPLLDSVLRGRVYDQVRFSTNFSDTNFFVLPEVPPFQDNRFLTETYDPRATTPKERTLYFNTGNTMGTLQYGEGGFMANVPSLQQGITDFSTAAGNNDTPFTPLSQLGVQFYNGENSDKNLSWESLYNANHSPKDNPGWMVSDEQGGGLNPIHYSPNVSRDNLNIGFNSRIYGERSGFGGQSRVSTTTKLQISQLGGDIEGLTELAFGGEPYIVSEIGNEGREKNRGGRFLPLERASTDVDRISKFLQSPEGVEFLIRQNAYALIPSSIIRRGNELYKVPQRFNSTLNPYQTLLAAGGRGIGQGVSNVLFRKGGLDIPLTDWIPGLTKEYGVDNTSAALEGLEGGLPIGTSNTGFSINDTFTAGGTGGKKTIGNMLKSGAISVANNIPGLSALVPLEKSYKGDEVTLQDIVSGDNIDIDYIAEVNKTTGNQKIKGQFKANKNVLAANITQVGFNDLSIPSPAKEENGLPFYFKDLRDKSYIFFRAYIEGLTENITPSYSTTNYIGRSEPVYIYERAEREISMTLKLVAQTKQELEMMYKKMDRLSSLCYPEYMDDTYGSRMKPPLTMLRYGELYGHTNNELMGFIKSLSYTVEQTSPYETDPGTGRVPKHIMATIGYQVIHKEVPRLGSTFYGINNRADDPTRLFYQGKLNKRTGIPKI